ncbi:23S rRNA (adenine-N6)-dimethyltransferase [Caldalkalibacillus uzonensis]|uniref:rRNA adenine N-6-methyltransferase n=1 Tax=Caldalkalibacillus uzonensis TaxID=353224 RepID=A0ABU0CU90_9BACI|nr:23S ribosomal RNA methyltransferase Erm [Caldalkalibacillus uzonensis]MDQ0339687.1 23S rRNA (adenine-N6)-dimethyltransferase [Caldalkalibacillus uzonensis]
MNKQNKRHRRVRKCIHGPNFLGQHFLHNKKVIEHLINMAHINAKDTVIEIGAGKGAITFSLAEKAGKVIAIEYDTALVETLRTKGEQYANLQIINMDFLNYKLPREPFSVVANIPFSITTPILNKLLNDPATRLQRAALIVEKRAAKRFSTYPITRPNILIWRMWFDFCVTREIKRTCFSPPPGVDTVVLVVKKKKKTHLSPSRSSLFRRLAEYGLRYPQLPLKYVFKDIFTAEQLKRICQNLSLNRESPVCMLKEHEWGIIFHTMMQFVNSSRWPKHLRR